MCLPELMDSGNTACPSRQHKLLTSSLLSSPWSTTYTEDLGKLHSCVDLRDPQAKNSFLVMEGFTTPDLKYPGPTDGAGWAVISSESSQLAVRTLRQCLHTAAALREGKQHCPQTLW